MSHPNLEELKDNFALFDDWEDRYQYLLDLAKTLPEMAEGLKIPENEVKGCQSRVWLVVERDEERRYRFIADSDGLITRGTIAILLIAYQGKTAEEIAKVDIEQAFTDLGLDKHLSPNRRNGFFAMVERIKALSN
ncbi:MAG: SufE family protein [Pseudomonadota bacterium]